MFEYLYKNKWLWLSLIIFLGCFFQFSLDVIFSLIYRNHALFGSLQNYLFSIAISFGVMYGLVKMAAWMNRTLSWENRRAGGFTCRFFRLSFL